MVREAVEYAIDKEAIVEATGAGVLEAPYGIASRSALAYDANVPVKREYDPAKAKQLLADAGYPNGFDTTFNIFPPASNANEPLLMQSQLKEVGINVTLDVTDWGRWVTFMGPGSWPENSVLYTPIPRFDKAFLGGIAFTFFNFGQAWERPPDLAQAFFGAMEPVEFDLSRIKAFINAINEDALLIPVHEGSWNVIRAPGVYRDIDERGYILFWNTEDAWMEK
jgi:ABC-type transport system substrate-binding protein